MKLYLILAILGLLAGACSRKAASSREETKAERERAEESRPGGALSSADSSEAKEEGEDEEAPEDEDIEIDCVAFLRATIAAPVQGTSKPGTAGDCPTCPATEVAPEVLKFDQVKIDRVSPADTTCEVAVRIFGTFNPSRGGVIAGGLTRWISAEQKAQYARGETPSGQQIYPVKITYRKTAHGWEAIEFN